MRGYGLSTIIVCNPAICFWAYFNKPFAFQAFLALIILSKLFLYLFLVKSVLPIGCLVYGCAAFGCQTQTPETAILCKLLLFPGEESVCSCSLLLSARRLLLPGSIGLPSTGSLPHSGTVSYYPVSNSVDCRQNTDELREQVFQHRNREPFIKPAYRHMAGCLISL